MALFLNDDRNLGGRKKLYDIKVNHQKALRAVKPTLNLAVPPRAHVNLGAGYFGDQTSTIFKNS